MKTDLQKRNEQLEDIILMADLGSEEHKTLRQQLESMSFMSIDVMHQVVTRMATAQTEESESISFERK